MYEVELKAPVHLESIRKQLRAIGAILRDEIDQEDTYYQHPQRDFAETDEALRIRAVRNCSASKESHHQLTYKGPVLDSASKTRREVETDVSDGAAMSTILENLSFEPVATVSKRREQWDLEGATVCLDAVANLGSFVEIEVRVEEDDIKVGSEIANELLVDLGVAADSVTTDSYLELLLNQSTESDRT